MGRSGARWLAAVLAASAVLVLPAAATLLVAPHAVRAAAPVSAAAWRNDPAGPPDPVRATPAAVRRYLTVRGAAVRQRLLRRFPGVLGALDGTPSALRYAANRRLMLAAGAPYRNWVGQFLLFDPRGTGRVAQVFGDLSSAQRIAVLVPGVDSRLVNFETGLGGRRYRAPAVQAAALYRAVSPGRTAVIAWLGYRTPHGVGRDAAREDLALAGAVALHRFLTGLILERPRATVTLLAHSYGSVVVGLAARTLPNQVRDIAVFGSPGMGVQRAAQLRTTARIWAGQAAPDWIRWVPGIRLGGLGHGRKPADPAFGARPFDTSGVRDHDHYLSPGTGSLTSLASIVLGTADRQARS